MKISGAWLMAVLLGWASAAAGQVTVSITIEGDIEDLIPILQMLQNEQRSTGADEAPLRIDLHSLLSEEEVTPAAPALTELVIEPARVQPGGSALIRVRVADEGGAIDTVAGQLGTAGLLQFDLYDNGTHGDEAARDGIWSCSLEVPEEAAPDRYPLFVKAYDVNGDEVWVEAEDGTRAALKAETAFEVVAAEE